MFCFCFIILIKLFVLAPNLSCYIGSRYDIKGFPCQRERVVNLIPDDDIQKQFSSSNTVYRIASSIDLNENSVVVPEGSTLLFSGGMFLNGEVICNNTLLKGRIKFRKCFLSGTILNEFITPEMFGASGNGKTDDSEAFGYAVSSSCKVLLNNQYRVKHPFLKSKDIALFRLSSGKEISGRGRIIVDAPVALFLIHSKSDIRINELTIDFNSGGIEKTASPSNHGIVIVNSNDVDIDNVTILSPKGDCIYIGSYNSECNHNNAIKIRNSRFVNFCRQGIAIIEGDNISIANCCFINEKHFYYGGIDIEPNHSYEAIRASISDCSFLNCGITTYRADNELNRNINLLINHNTVKKQLGIVGGIGSHNIGIKVQDAVTAIVRDNIVEGFLGITAYNCDTCFVMHNTIVSTYRGISCAAVDSFIISDNLVDMIPEYDFTEAQRINPALVKYIGNTIEVSSSDGEIQSNDLMGKIWVRNSSRVIVVDNICRGDNGSILLNMNRSSGDHTKATVIRNICQAKGDDVYPIIVLKGVLPIEYEISDNTFLAGNNRGVFYPK